MRYKLGVQASSDHGSTHVLYACVIAENFSRKGIMDAIRARHTYGPTSNMLLDFRARTGTDNHLEGDILSTTSLPELSAHIGGTGRLSRVVLIRDNRYLYSHEPAGESYDLRYYDNECSPGDHYYYVRVEQKDGNVAWSSPIWIAYRGAGNPRR